jgi:hypothetical protein
MRVVLILGALGILAGGVAYGQEVILPAHELPASEVAAELVMREPRMGLFRLGPVDVTPRLSSSVYYDDNVNRRPEKEDDVVITVAPGITGVARDLADGLGKVMRLDYSPAFLFYTQGKRGDEVSHNARVEGSLLFPRVTLGLSQRVTHTSDPDVDVEGRSQRTDFGTALTSRYVMGEKTSLEVNFTFDLVDYELDTLSDYWGVANQNWVNYQYSEKVGLGLGLVLGYIEVEDFPNQTYQQLLGRVTYAIAEKVDLSVSAGGELRQYRGGVGDSVNPVWTVTGAYRPRDGTAVTLGLYQQFSTSATFGSQDFLRTGGSVTLRQRVYRRVSFTVSGLYYHSDYEATVVGVVATRVDDSFGVRLGLDTRLGQRWTAGLFYDYLHNRSTEDRFDYDRQRVGARVAWAY